MKKEKNCLESTFFKKSQDVWVEEMRDEWLWHSDKYSLKYSCKTIDK